MKMNERRYEEKRNKGCEVTRMVARVARSVTEARHANEDTQLYTHVYFDFVELHGPSSLESSSS